MKKVILGLAVSTFVLASFAADEQKPASPQPQPAAAVTTATKTASTDKTSSASADKTADSDDSCAACDGDSGSIPKKAFLSPRAKEVFGKKALAGL